jgi:amino acid transporter
MYVMSYIGSGLLLRYTEGATYLAIVQSLVTPLGALFWSLFNTDHCGGFFWEPHADSLTYFSIGGIILIVPAILLYNVNLGIKDFIQVILNMIDR